MGAPYAQACTNLRVKLITHVGGRGPRSLPPAPHTYTLFCFGCFTSRRPNVLHDTDSSAA
ncbi:hypothetical protein RSAG8_10039, partial [Rhizoctonia solani AG-8 WAC10335]